MSKESLDRPFTADELNEQISDCEAAFRVNFRLSGTAFDVGAMSECDRFYRNAARNANILAELRYQRERIS